MHMYTYVETLSLGNGRDEGDGVIYVFGEMLN